MSVPDFPSFDKVPNTVNEVIKEFLARRAILEKGMIDIKRTTPKAAKALKDGLNLAKEAKDISGEIVKNMPGGGTVLQKAGKAGMTLGGLAVSAATYGIVIADLKWVRPMLQKAQEEFNDKLVNDLSKTLGLIQLQKSRIDTANGEIYQLKQQDQRNRDRIYKVEQEVPNVRAMANDALYEVRAGRQILENKITENQKKTEEARKLGNDALYEVRAGRTILEERLEGLQSFAKNLLNNAKAEFNKSIDATFKDVSRQLLEAKRSADKTNNEINDINKLITVIRAQIAGIPPGQTIDVERIKADIAARLTPELQAYLKSISPGSLINFDIEKSRIDNLYDLDKNRRLQDLKWQGIIDTVLPKNTYLDNFVNKLNQEFQQFKERTELNIQAAQGVAGAQDKLNQRFQQDITDIDTAWRNNFNGLDTFTKSLQKIQTDREIERQRQIKELDDKINENERKVIPSIQQAAKSEVGKQLEPIKADLTSIKQDLNQKTKEIQKIDTGLKERIEVDRNVERKIDSIIPTIAGIPFIVGRIPGQTTNLITPRIPTTPQIGNIVKDSVCNPKCQLPSIGASNNAANDIKNDLGQKIRDGNAAIQSGALAEILRRLGDFIPGGISGKLVNGFKWLQLDRALNILTFAATVHNAAMLSNDILQTLVGALTNALTLIIPKDDAGKSFDIGQAINSTVENTVKGIIGAENYTNLSNTWAKANRIYQATTNVLNSFLSLTQTVLQAAEMIAAYTGKIGNALKKGGVVLENAYGWMNPQPKFNRVTQTLENLQQGASTVQMVTQVPLDVVNATTELTTASTDFVKAIKEDDNPANKATPIPEPDDLKAKEVQAKIDSQPVPFDFSDLFDGEDE